MGAGRYLDSVQAAAALPVVMGAAYNVAVDTLVVFTVQMAHDRYLLFGFIAIVPPALFFTPASFFKSKPNTYLQSGSGYAIISIVPLVGVWLSW